MENICTMFNIDPLLVFGLKRLPDVPEYFHVITMNGSYIDNINWCDRNIGGRYGVSSIITKLEHGGYRTEYIIGFERTADIFKYKMCFNGNQQ